MMNATNNYLYLPTYFPELVACARQMLGVHREKAEDVLRQYLPREASLLSTTWEPMWIEMSIEGCVNVDSMDLLFYFDLSKQCQLAFLVLRGPVPQLGDCVHYFNAAGEYLGRRWRLAGAEVTLDKTEDETCCCFSPIEATD